MLIWEKWLCKNIWEVRESKEESEIVFSPDEKHGRASDVRVREASVPKKAAGGMAWKTF